MNLVILALFDAKVMAFMTPFFSQSVGAGMRSLADLVNSGGDEPPARHPEDFRLYHLGTFSTDGHIDVKSSPELVCEAVNLKREE